MRRNLRSILVAMSLAIPVTAGLLSLDFVVSSQDADLTKPPQPVSQEPATIVAKGRGFPRVNFEDGRSIEAPGDQGSNRPSARQLASADFDSDGVADLVTIDAGGGVRFFRGNIDSIFPNSSESEERKAAGKFADSPFYASKSSFFLAIAPDYLETGDFNADGLADLLTAAKGGTSLFVSVGDGKGNFSATTEFSLPGSITALAVGEIGRADGQADVAVAVQDKRGSALFVFEHPTGAFAYRPERVQLKGKADEIALGYLDGDAFSDLAVAAGSNLTLIRGRGHVYPWDILDDVKLQRPAPMVESRTMPFQIAAMEAGYFTDRRGQSLALLSAAGEIVTLDTHPVKKAALVDVSRLAKSDVAKPMVAEAREFSTFRTYSEPMRPIKDEIELLDHPELIPGDITDIEAYREEIARRKREHLASLPPEVRAAKAAEAKANAEASRERTKVNFLKAISPEPAEKLASWEMHSLAADTRIAAAAASKVNSSKGFLRVRVSDSGRDELAMIDPASNQIHLLIRDNPRRFADTRVTDVISLDTASPTTAILPMRLNMDGLTDLVVLTEGSAVPSTLVSAPAAVFTVTTLADEDDGSCGSPCSLREAIEAANTSPGTDTIEFAVTGIMQPTSALPTIEFAVTINGTNAPIPQVEIRGSSAGDGANGLAINAASVVIRRLAIGGFQRDQPDPQAEGIGGHGITIFNFEGDTFTRFAIIEGSYLGTNISGTIDRGNESSGLQIFDSDNNTIGGTAAAARNVISGNGTGEVRDSTIHAAGISIVDGRFNLLRGNYIGTNAAGTSALGNSSGVFASGSNNEYGGDPAGSMNVISGNRHLVTITNDPDGCRGGGLSEVSVVNETTGEWITHDNNIKGNRVGTNANGSAQVGNCRTGIYTSPRHSVVIGSITPAGRNLASGNDEGGIFCTRTPPLAVMDFLSGLAGPAGDDEENEPPVGFCTVRGNTAGTDATGSFAIPNTYNHFIPQVGLNFINPGGAIAVDNTETLSTIGNPGGTSTTGCTGFCNLAAGEITTVEAALAIDVGIGGDGEGTIGIFNNYSGVNITGTAAIANATTGITGGSDPEPGGAGDVRIGGLASGPGGTQTSLGNLSSGNTALGIGLSANRPNALAFVQANLIGTDRTGLLAIPNGSGLGVSGDNNGIVFVGGGLPGEGNVISGNTGDGLTMRPGDFLSGITRNNLIGVNKDGQPLGNGGDGVVLMGTYDYLGDAGAGNIIANNGGNGITVRRFFAGTPNPLGNRIKYNSIFNNGGLGIDLSADEINPITGDGVTDNDCDDIDSGPHGLQNYPILTAPQFNGDGTVTVGGAFDSTPSTAFTLDFYSNSEADPSGYGEGETYIGSASVTTDDSGIASFLWTSTGPVASTLLIAGTASDIDGNTSEFSCIAGQCSITGASIEEQLKSAIEKAAPSAGCSLGFVVNVTTDDPDPNPADGICDSDLDTTGQQCSLRAAIQSAEAISGTDFINFDIPGGGVQTISPTSQLPDITHPVLINATTQPGYVNTPMVELNGSATGQFSIGINFTSGSHQSKLEGMAINRFGEAGIQVVQADEVTIARSHIGLSADGMTVFPQTQQYGVVVRGAKTKIGIERVGGRADNLFAGNRFAEISVPDALGRETIILANDFGMYRDGSPVPSKFQTRGIQIHDGGSQNRIGGSSPEQSNRIMNMANGIEISNFGQLSTGGENIVIGNTIMNCGFGITISRSGDNVIGGSEAGEGNDIGLNTFGIEINDLSDVDIPSFVDNNKILGNRIGYSDTIHDFGNTGAGISIRWGNNHQIGGTSPGERNVISGNGANGIHLGEHAALITIKGNAIGTTPDGSQAKGNGSNGINITGGSPNTVEANVISANAFAGVLVDMETNGTIVPNDNLIQNNLVGLAVDGTELPNKFGIWLQAGETIVLNNVISANNEAGMLVQSDENHISENLIGTDANGQTAKGNGGYGIDLRSSTNQITANTISGNKSGIFVFGFDEPASNNQIKGNFIGTNADGTAPLKNLEDGIQLNSGAVLNFIGGTTAGAGNLISGNGRNGILIHATPVKDDVDPFQNKIEGNRIGTNGAGTAAVRNEAAGIEIIGAIGTRIGGFGGDMPGARNVISGNGTDGIRITVGALQTRISGNLIGTTIDGTSPLGNTGNGVFIGDSVGLTKIGGLEANAGNTIAYNGSNGILAAADAGNNNIIDPNLIFGNTLMGIDIGGDGHTPNDPGDADVGPNKLQNYPVIVSKQVVGGELIVTFKIDSAPEHSAYGASGIYVEFFKADASGEGELFVASTHYTLSDYQSGSPGNKTVNLGPIATLGITELDRITATATDADGNTSEFTPAMAPTAAGVEITGRVKRWSGQGISNATIQLNGTNGKSTVRTNTFGYFRFTNVAAGESYLISTAAKGLTFEPLLINVEDSISGIEIFPR